MDAKRTVTLIFLECRDTGTFMPAKKKTYPVIRTGRMESKTGPFPQPPIEVNVEQLLSKVNRRLYRHAREYEVKIDIDATSSQIYHVYALSDSWMNDRALKMAYAMYLENSADERGRLKDANIARWEDFRTLSGFSSLYGQVDPVQFGTPTTGGKSPYTSGEFSTTFVVDAAGVSKAFSWGASTASQYSLLEEYDKAGNAQSAPSTSTGDMPYDDLMADDDATMGAMLQTSGNQPPYDSNGVSAGSPWVKIATLHAGAAQKLSTGFFKAPCGYVLISAGADGEVIPELQFVQWTCKAGDYKGVHAPSYVE